jgi:hypothetical protein
VEQVWWALKEACAANERYASLEAVQDAIHGFCARFDRTAALRLTAKYAPSPRLFLDPPASSQLDERLPLAA